MQECSQKTPQTALLPEWLSSTRQETVEMTSVAFCRILNFPTTAVFQKTRTCGPGKTRSDWEYCARTDGMLLYLNSSRWTLVSWRKTGLHWSVRPWLFSLTSSLLQKNLLYHDTHLLPVNLHTCWFLKAECVCGSMDVCRLLSKTV